MGVLSRLFDRIPEENTTKPFFQATNADERRHWFAHTRPWHKVRPAIIDALIAKLDHDRALFELFVQTSLKGGLVPQYAALHPSAEGKFASILIGGILSKLGMATFVRHQQCVEQVRGGNRSESLMNETIATGSFAIDCFEVAIALESTLAPACWGLAVLLMEIRRYEEALKYARQGLAAVRHMKQTDYSESTLPMVRAGGASLGQMEATLSKLVSTLESEAGFSVS